MIRTNLLKHNLKNYFHLSEIFYPKQMNTIEILLEVYTTMREPNFSQIYDLEKFIDNNFSDIYFILYRLIQCSKDTFDVMMKTILYIKFFSFDMINKEMDYGKEYKFLPFYFNDKITIKEEIIKKGLDLNIKNFRNETIEEYCEKNNIII